MDAAERNRLWEKRLFKALLTEKAKLQSELETTPRHQRLGLRLEIEACETLLAVLDPARGDADTRLRPRDVFRGRESWSNDRSGVVGGKAPGSAQA